MAFDVGENAHQFFISTSRWFPVNMNSGNTLCNQILAKDSRPRLIASNLSEAYPDRWLNLNSGTDWLQLAGLAAFGC